MAAAIGWYGPLIDLSGAASHLDDFVQLLVFVHRSQPIQKCTTPNGKALLKTKIYVGDDTRSHFPISLWQKQMGSLVASGDILLLQNVQLVKFRNTLEAAMVQVSSVIALVHLDELTTLTVIDDLVAKSQLGETARKKLRRVINWVQHTESTLQHVQPKQRQLIKNWKVHVEKKSWTCLSVSKVLCLTSSCNAIFRAYIGEITLQPTHWPDVVEEGLLPVSKRSLMTASNRVAEHLISTGCKLCGSPMDSRSLLEQEKIPLYCPKDSKYLHEACLIYRPFLLNLWDQDGQIPVLVKNKAAEILFGNITAEDVYKCHQEEKNKKICNHRLDRSLHHSIVWNSSLPKSVGSTYGNCQPGCARLIDSSGARAKPNFYLVWLILVKLLLQQDKNTPFLFEVSLDREKVLEDGRFELVSFKLPCNGAYKS